MYRVITLYGTDEPWWFFDGWKDDIVSVTEFEDFYKALKWYKKEWLKLAQVFEEYRSQEDLLAAFWESGDQEWCEECVDYLQRYHSIALLEDWHEVPADKKRAGYSKTTGSLPNRFCALKNEN